MTKTLKILIFLLLPALIFGCNVDREREQAVSPSSKYWLNPNELSSAKEAAGKGDVGAMKKVADHYLHSDNEVEGMYWLEKAGDAGDIGVRQSVIDYYDHVPQQEGRKRHGDELRKRWAMQ